MLGDEDDGELFYQAHDLAHFATFRLPHSSGLLMLLNTQDRSAR